MTVYAGDRASSEVLARVQAALAPVCAALGGAGLHRLTSDLPPYGWRFEMRRESVRPTGMPVAFVAGQGWPIRVHCFLRRGAAAPGPVVWTEPGWSLAGLVVLVADLGPGADWAVKRRGLDGWDHMGLWPALEAVSSAVLVGGYVGRLS
mgnify:CR=1 FL=1